MNPVIRRLAEAIVVLAAVSAEGSGALDPTFGTGGIAAFPGFGLAVQGDGNIVAPGGATVASPVFGSVSVSFTLRRLTAAGAQDVAITPTVAACGFCASAIGGTAAVAIQPDGRIVAAGFTETTALSTGACKAVNFVVTRQLAGGGLDTSFSGDGIATIGQGEANGVALQADGKIVVAGSKKNYVCLSATQPPDHSLARLNTDGTPDAGFGTGGVVNSPLGTGDDMAHAVAIRPDGKIVVAGHATNGAARDFAVAIYGTTGVLEVNALHDLGADDVAYAMALQPDGKIVLGGFGGNNFALVRLTAPGSYDAAFGFGGKVIGPGAPIRALALQPDGKIVAAMGDGDVLRFDASGTQDGSFGIGGRVSTAMTGVLSLALQADGKIVVGSATQVARIDPAAVVPIAPSPAVVDFLGQSLNTTSPPQPVTLTNNTGSSQTIASITATVGFAVTHDCTTLAPAASCTASVTYTPVFEGPNAGDLVVTGSAGTQKAYLLGTGEKSLVTHYYRAILRRAPDAPGKAFWQGEATRMQSIGANVNEAWYAMAQFFFFSAEYLGLNRDDAGFVTDLYITFFNRAPDGGGLNFWVSNLQQGMPREVLLASFMFSTEFANFTQAIFGNTAARPEVDVVMDFYRGLLARLPDPDGFTAWVNNFRSAQCAGTGVAVVNMVEAISSGFANSGEYVGRNRTNAQYVGDLYNSFLRRGGDLGGVQFWINDLNASARTRENVRQNFIASGEFQARVTAVVNQGCLP